MIVSDSTLLVHLVVPLGGRPETDDARRVFDRDSDWHAPALWTSETRNALLKYVRNGDLDLEDALTAVEELSSLVTIERVGHAEVLEAALAFGLSGYDAEYAALSDRLEVPLVTSDKRVLRVHPRAVSPAEFVG